MRTTTTAFDLAKNKTGAEPVWLLQLDSGASTYYYSDRAVTVDSQAYAARVLAWGNLTGINKRMTGGGVVNSTTIALTELPTSISSKVAIGNVCRVYLWFEGESLTDSLLMFKGTITDPIEVTETSLTFRIDGYEESRNSVVGELITSAEFSGASEYALGKVKPIIYGQVYEHECLPVDAGSITTLTADIAADSTADIAVTDTTSFPSSGNIWVEAEKIAYTGKTATTFTGISRAQSSTTATAHSRGAYAVEDQTNYDYLIAGHSCQTPDAVYINGVALTSGWSKVASGGNDLLRVTDGEALREALRGGVADDLGVTSSLSEATTIVQESATGELYNKNTLSYPNPTYVEYAYSDDITFSTLTGCTFSEVYLNIETHNLAKLQVNIWLNGNTDPVPDRIDVIFDYYDGLGGSSIEITDTYSFNVAANEDITKIRVWCGYDLRNTYSSVLIGFANVGSVVRSATVPQSVTSSKDTYAYATGITTTENLHGAKITIDIVGYNYSRPDEVVEHLLLNYGNSIVAGDLDTSVAANTDYSTNYPIGFAITEQQDLGRLCRQIAYQSASRFFWDSGKAYLNKIPESATVSLPTGWTATSGLTVIKDKAAGNSVKIVGDVDDYIELTLGTGETDYDANIDLWIKTDGTAQIEAKVVDDTGAGSATYTESVWTSKNLTINNNAGTVKLRFTIKNASGTVWIDDVIDSSNRLMYRFHDWQEVAGLVWPTNWVTVGCTTYKDTKRDGAYSVKLYSDSYQNLSKQVATGQSGTSVNFKYLVKTTDSCQVLIVDDGGALGGTKTNADWQLYEMSGQTVNGNVEIQIEIFGGSYAWVDSLLWDEVSLDEDFSTWSASDVSKVLTPDDIVYGSMRMRYTPNKDIINSIDAQYDPRGREYLAVESDSDSSSISTYGTRDGSHKLQLDLINNSTAAANVVDDYLLKFKAPKKVAEFSTPLQNIELQRGDIVAITHPIDGGWTAKTFEVMETSVTIGNTNTPDQIRFVAEET